MDATRIHLFITHLPLFGLFLGFFVLLFGLLRKDKGVKVVALAMIFVAILAVLGVLSAVGLYMEIKNKRYAKQMLVMVLAFSACAFYFVARTAMQGGQIRHTEISNQR